ncbi:MAG: hypothetical protein ACREIT_08055, partial [Tepidisphaeraceae bacterium]
FCGKRDGPPGLAAPAPGAASIAVASLLLIAAVSVKATTVYALPVATLYVAWPMLKRGLTFADRAAWFRRGVALSAPVILMLGIWTVRSYYLKGGEFWFEEVQGLTAHSADDPMWLTGEKVARVPTTGDLAMLPAVPVLVTVMGQMEPYGGRTGLLLLAFVPVGLIAVRRLPDAQRHLVYWMLAAAAAYFFGLGPTGIKTRYHLFVWTMFAVVAGIGFKFMNDYRRESSLARVGLLVFYVLVTFGMGDIAHVIGRRLTRFYA